MRVWRTINLADGESQSVGRLWDQDEKDMSQPGGMRTS